MTRTSLQVPVPGQILVAERWGASSPPLVVLLHAGVADRRSWYEVAERIAPSVGVVAYDRRGYGESPPGEVPFRHVDDLLLVLDRVSPAAPAWLVGNSAGGQVALDAALARPDRVAGLVLIAPAVSGAPEPDRLDEDTQRLSDLLDVADAAADLTEVNRLETWLWLDGPAGPEGRVAGAARQLAEAMNAIPLGHGAAEAVGSAGTDAWAELDRLRLPVVVAWGELDVAFLRDQGERLAARLPNARGRVLTGTAHLPSLDAPDQVADLILEALAAP